MKQELLDLIKLVVQLLVESGWQDKATWFENVGNRLSEIDVSSEIFRDCLDELDRSISGMGSFSDLPLESTNGKRTGQELRNEQWELTEKLGDAIERLKEKMCQPSSR